MAKILSYTIATFKSDVHYSISRLVGISVNFFFQVYFEIFIISTWNSCSKSCGCYFTTDSKIKQYQLIALSKNEFYSFLYKHAKIHTVWKLTILLWALCRKLNRALKFSKAFNNDESMIIYTFYHIVLLLNWRRELNTT